jgi:hypothetical protein
VSDATTPRSAGYDAPRARAMYADVAPTGRDTEPTGVVEVSIEALRMLAAAAGFELVERVNPPRQGGSS